MVADAGVAAQNRCSRVNGDAVLDVRVALVLEAADQFRAVAAAGRVERAEGHAVIERYVVANRRGFSDHYSRAVIDKK